MRSTLSTFDEIWQQQFRKRLLTTLDQFQPSAKIILGCSGGMDSMLLLHLFIALIPARLHVISIDHQLQQHSAAWSNFVAKTCQQFQIPCQIVKVQVQHGNVEAQARAARYLAFLAHLNPDDVLVLAHHQQDQAETVILRLLQGSGVRGLAAMRELETRALTDQTNYFLWRPLLDLSKQHIQQWVQQLRMDYIDDPMNADMHYDRVWCREQLWQVLEQRFPKMQDSMARCALLMQDAEQILNEVLEDDLKQCVDEQQRLSIEKLRCHSIARQRQIISTWMQADQSYRPALAMVERLQQEVIAARVDAQSILHDAPYYFVRFAGNVYRYHEEQWQAWQCLLQAQHMNFDWTSKFSSPFGDISIQKTDAMGLDETLFGQTLLLVPRQGGEKIQFYGRSGHRVLKKVLQDAKIAPWFRHQTLIFMYHNVVLGVLTVQGFWLAQSAYCKAQGWLPHVQTNIHK